MNRGERVAKVGVLAALYCLCASITIPFIGMPMTFQCFAVAAGSFCFGAPVGVAATAVYVAIGAAGLPVFSGFGGGVQVLFGPTGGYIWGFFALALLCGFSKGKLKDLALGTVGLVTCYGLGCIWYAYVSGMGLWTAFLVGGAPYILKDFLLLLAAYPMAIRLKRAIGKAKPQGRK